MLKHKKENYWTDSSEHMSRYAMGKKNQKRIIEYDSNGQLKEQTWLVMESNSNWFEIYLELAKLA